VSQIQDVSARKEIDRLKREFVSTMSHELRTPLTSIRGSLELIASGVTGLLPEEAGRFVEIASQNTGRLERIVNNILDVQMIESGQMILDLASHSMAPLVERAVTDNQRNARIHRVNLVLRKPLPAVVAKVDPSRIVQVLGNLLSNAIKFSLTGAEVEIDMTTGAGTTRVSVTDHGPGISTSYQPRIFTRFSQADSSDRRQADGTGLGLAIAKALIECMGGKVGYSSDPGIATTFFLELPLSA
jgi:signal transduction histidine kinase